MPRKPLSLSASFSEETATVQRIHRKVLADTSFPPEVRQKLLEILGEIVSTFNVEAARRAMGKKA